MFGWGGVVVVVFIAKRWCGLVLSWHGFGVFGWGGVVVVVFVFGVGVGVGVVFGRITVTAATDMAVMTAICVTTF